MNHRVAIDSTAYATMDGERAYHSPSSLLSLYRSMLIARVIDEHERKLVASGEALFHVSGAGHEAVAVFADVLNEHDWLHLHYRDKALMLARGVPAAMFFHSLLCSAVSHSNGRQMSAHLSDPARRVLSLVGPVGNNALQAVGVAAQVTEAGRDELVLCCVGDGTSQQGEFLEVVAEAVRERLPVLFVVEDNRYSISTRTAGRTFYEHPAGEADHFYGLPIHRLDGRDPLACIDPARALVDGVRTSGGPALAVMKVERLSDHTNADDQSVYREASQIETASADADPVRNLRAALITDGVDERELKRLECEVREQVAQAAAEARQVDDPPPEPVMEAKAELPVELCDSAKEYRGDAEGGELVMGDAIREVLRHHLARNERVTLFGQDIEDPKGDVFGVTRGISTQFPGRVVNAPLAEATIVGKSVGRALAGGRPVAFLQFADFLPIAFNHIISELGSMNWRTCGGWRCPVIVMVTCGGYRPGLGPFHAQTLESIAAHVPGVDVFMPSTAGDAAGMLNAAFASQRPTIFFYPKALLNDRGRATSADVDRQLVPIGKARFITRGDDLTLVSYGSTMAQCHKAAEALDAAGVGVDLIDLRSIFPWDREAVCESAQRTCRLLVVHEDNATCGMAGEIIATVSERVDRHVQSRRVTRPDTYVPCNFANQLEVLPSFKRVLSAAAEMLELDLTWHTPTEQTGNLLTVEAQGSSPADESVTVTKWHIADLEADKAVFEFAAPETGVVKLLLAQEGDELPVGSPLLRIEMPDDTASRKRLTREEPGTPQLARRTPSRSTPTTGIQPVNHTAAARELRPVYIAGVTHAPGSRTVSNAELLGDFTDWTAADVEKRVGITTRQWIAEDENAVTLASRAVRDLLDQLDLDPANITAILCSTGNGHQVSPSIACELVTELFTDVKDHRLQALDINAACTGYLYALQQAHDMLQHAPRPSAGVLVVTSEVISTFLNRQDPDTVFLFGDAATATYLTTDRALAVSTSNNGNTAFQCHRPHLASSPDPSRAIEVPLPGRGHLAMDGITVAREASRAMAKLLEQACAAHELAVTDLDWIVPHQASKRVIDSVTWRAGVEPDRVVTALDRTGNTSSSSIPICLAVPSFTPTPVNASTLPPSARASPRGRA